MITIIATCPMCGEIRLNPDQILLFEPPTYTSTGEPNTAPDSEYQFVCPQCSQTISKPCDLQTVCMLLSAGITPTPRKDLPISLEDVAGFSRMLTATDELCAYLDGAA